MIVSWMLYSFVVALLLGLGARPLERALRLGGRPGRWVWVGAVVAALLVPVVSFGLALGTSETAVVGLGPVVPVAAPVSAALGGVADGLGSAAAPVLESLAAPLLRLWALASLALLGVLAASGIRLGRFRRALSERVLDGDRVLVSRDVGPAVLGLFRHRVVVPRWVLDRGPEARRLILDHEREHCRARDPLLVFLAALPAVVLPWNAPLWWCLSRLRLAVELDCDQRVLRAASPGTRRRYGRLLVEVGRRPGGAVPVLAAFSERRSALERRVRALTDRLPDRPLRRAAAWAGLGVLTVLAACVVPSPDATRTSLEPEGTDVPAAARDAGRSLGNAPVFTPYTLAPQLTNAEEVRRALLREYPPVLRDAGIGGLVDVWFFIDEEGRVRSARLHEPSGHEELDAAALRVADIMRFTPALNRDEPVPVWISLPIRFEVRAEGRPTDAAVRPPPDIRIPPPPEAIRSRPMNMPPPRGGPPTAEEGPVFTPYTRAPQLRNAEEVQRALVAEYPPLLRDAGIGGTTQVWFLIDETGRVVDTRLHEASGHPRIDEAALRVAEVITFTPALNRDATVPVWISLPITFEVR